MVGLTSSGVLANASMLLSNGSWYNIFDLFEKWQAAASLYSTANALIHQNNKQSKNIAQSQQRDTPLTTQPAELLPAEKIAKILSHVSINRIENNQNPIPALNDAIVQLARQTTPEDMCVALTALQQEFIQVPVIAEHCQAQIEVIELYQAQILKQQSPHQQTIKGV
jgi:predicted component of type VI protein secretion system